LRTGRSFAAWLQQASAPPDAQPVCRFYSTGANSHFYTAEASECTSLKALEASQRAAAAQAGEAFTGWAFEATAFVPLANTWNGLLMANPKRTRSPANAVLQNLSIVPRRDSRSG